MRHETPRAGIDETTDRDHRETLVELYLNRLETRESVQEKNELLRRIARVFEKVKSEGHAAEVAEVVAAAKAVSYR